MQRHGLWFGALIVVSACGSDAPPATFTTGESSSGDEPTTMTMTSSAEETSSGPNTTMPMTSSVDPDSSSDGGGSSEGTTTTAGDESSESGCTAGTLGCPCDDGTCGADSICVAGTCEAPENCNIDGYEPNDDEASAVYLGELGDGDDPGSIAGELDHEDDVDWFTYDGADNLGVGPGVAPARTVDADGGLRLCKFLECPDGIGETEVTCPDGTDLAQSPSGRPGCCGPTSMAMPDFNCDGTTDDSAAVYIRIDNAALQCVQYTIGYEF